MAILRLETGRQLDDLVSIGESLAPLNVRLDRWPVGRDAATHQLLAQPSLDEAQKEVLLRSLDHYFESLENYQSRDAIVLNPETPNLDGLLEKFSRPHIHADDEVRYIVDGEGVFGFVCPDGTQMELTVQPEEYINVLAGTEHWFHLTPLRRIKAIRYFIDTSGWTPEYTGTAIRMQAVAV
ncbi:1,2-dihydroxy-3-keto-5-methylthiopentene dioxygenase [Altericista sp. CCNU0014]|uniref:1,2-dihydroxy-3-keto-5-methylthiopentene dioxygenase n=1 Tax=Altericista sp. CCNU0014 TaxID=3082949 RepID=UPI00384E727A